MVEIDLYSLSAVAALSAGAAMSSLWFYASKLLKNERQQYQKLEQELNKTKELERWLRLDISESKAENKRLKALFEIPTLPNKVNYNEKWSSLAQVFESQLARLGCESRDVISAVGSMKTALPIAMEQLNGSAARLYVAAAVSTMNAADTIAKEIGKTLQLKKESAALQVTVEIENELMLRVGRLDTQKDGLVLLCVGKQARLNETAWMRTMMTLHNAPELIGKSLMQESSKASSSQVPELPIVKGLSLPYSLITSLSRAGISNVIFYSDADEEVQSTNWVKQISEALRRVPKGQNENVSFRVRLFDMPETEIVINKVPNGWLVIQTDLTKPEPWRLIDQVMGFLRFKGQANSVAV